MYRKSLPTLISIIIYLLLNASKEYNFGERRVKVFDARIGININLYQTA